MTGRLISTGSQFPNVAVFEEICPHGEIYRISFLNKEVPQGIYRVTSPIILIASLAFLAWTFTGLPRITEGMMGLPWYVSPLIGFAAVIITFWKLKIPWTFKRSIELDAGANRFRVLNKSRVELERELDRLYALTVDEHPEAEVGRVNRMNKGQKSPSQQEMQHCLFGWFGESGAEQVTLVTRYEWPNRGTLQEVQKAIQWAIEQAGSGAPLEAKEAGRFHMDTIKPPLD